MMQYFNMRASRFLSAVIACVASPSISLAQSLWDHNGSQMRLEAQGNARKFIYESPRQGLSAKPGDVLFEGSRSGKTYSGTAYLFSSKCGQIAYKVSGEVGADDRSVTMSGKAPRRDANCQVTSYTDDKLSFTLMSSSATARNSTSNSIGTQTSTSGQSAAEKIIVTLKEFSCGDNCYLVVLDNKGREETLVCADKICGDWADANELPVEYMNLKAEITISVKNLYTASGKVAGRNISADKIVFLSPPNQLNKSAPPTKTVGPERLPLNTSATSATSATAALSSPLSCKFSDALQIIECLAQSDKVKVDEIRIKDQISSTCRQFYYEVDERALIHTVLSRLSPQEREALDKNSAATLSYLRESKRFTAKEMQTLQKYVMLNVLLRYDAFVKPLEKGDSFFITFQSCPAIDSVEVVINGEAFGVWKR